MDEKKTKLFSKIDEIKIIYSQIKCAIHQDITNFEYDTIHHDQDKPSDAYSTNNK